MSIFRQIKFDFSSSHYAFILSAIGLLLSIFAIWFVRFLPLQDYPDWLFQAHLLSNSILNKPSPFTQHYYSIFPVLPPNFFAVLLIALINLIIDIELAGKLYLTIYVLTFSAGVYYLFSFHSKYHPLRWLGIPLSFSFFFYLGTLNYITGLALLPFAMSSTLRIPQKKPFYAFFIIFIWSILLYSCHATIFCFYFLFVLIFLFSFSINSQLIKILILIAFLPSIVLLIQYMASRQILYEFVFYNELRTKALTILSPLFFVHRIQGLDTSIPYSLINLFIFITLTLCCWFSIIRFPKAQKKYFLFAMILFAIALFFPVMSINKLYGVEARIIYPALLLLLISISFIKPILWIERCIAFISVLFAILNMVQFKLFIDTASKIYPILTEYYSKSASPLVISAGYDEEIERSITKRISANIRSFMRLYFYSHLEAGHPGFLTISQTGLYKWRNSEITVKTERAEDLAHFNFFLSQAVAKLKTNINFLRENFDFIFIIGTEQVQDALVNALSPTYVIAQKAKILSVLRRLDF